MKTLCIEQIAARLRAEGLPPPLGTAESQLVIEMLRTVARGQPVRPEQEHRIISSLGIPRDEGSSFLSTVSERDNDGNIVGIFGLSQKDHPHRFEVNGNELSGWCAWDTLFLPALLNETANVRSVCPVTKKPVQLTVTPDAVERCQPATAVLSIVLPELPNEGVRPAKEIRMFFCRHVLFFSSPDAASEWFTKSSYDPIILSVREGYELGVEGFRALIDHARSLDLSTT